METVEVTFLNKNYFYQSDEPEAFRKLCKSLAAELDQLMEEYPSFSREQLLILYILRQQDDPTGERVQQPPTEPDKEEIEDEQLGVDLDEINEILNTDI